MPSLKVLDTTRIPSRAAELRGGSRMLTRLRWTLLPAAVLGLAGLGVSQQKESKKGGGPAGPALERTGEKAPQKADKKPAPRKAGGAQATWSRVTGTLLGEYFVRRPDQGIQRDYPEARELRLGTFGTDSAIRWRAALTDARAGLAGLELDGSADLAAVQLRAFEAWLEGEILLLDGQSLATTDPA